MTVAPRRYLLRVLAACAVVMSPSCSLVRDDSPEVVADSVVVAQGPDSTLADDSSGADRDSVVAEGAQDSNAGSVGAEPEAATTTAAIQTLTIDQRIEQLLVSQEAVNRRLDLLTASAGAGQDSVRSLSGSGEVLGEAGQRARSFGVGIVWSVLVLIFFNVVIRGVVWLLDALAERNASRRLFYKRLVPIVRIILWVFAAYLIVSVIFQVDAQGIFAAAAAIGVAIGFAAQDLLKNLFGGLILVFDQPFQVGDKVSVGGTYGEVVSIGLRSTRIVTPDDNLVSVPNAQVVDQQVANANAGELHCQVVTDLFLPGWADEGEAKRIAFDAAASSKYVYLNKPIVTLVSDVFKETFLTRVRVKAYVLDPRLEFMFQSEVTERARAGFREAGLLKREHMEPRFVNHSAIEMPSDTPDRGDDDEA